MDESASFHRILVLLEGTKNTKSNIIYQCLSLTIEKSLPCGIGGEKKMELWKFIISKGDWHGLANDLGLPEIGIPMYAGNIGQYNNMVIYGCFNRKNQDQPSSFGGILPPDNPK